MQCDVFEFWDAEVNKMKWKDLISYLDHVSAISGI